MKGLSPRAEKLIAVLAQKEGRQSGGTQLLPEHVLIALLKSASGLGYILLQTLHVNILAYQLALEQGTVSQNPVVDYSDLPPGRRLRTLLDCAAVESRSLKNGYIGTEHLVLAAIREDGSITARYFEKAGISLDSIRNVILDIQSKNKSSAASETRDDVALGNVFQNVYSGNTEQSNNSRNAQKKKGQPSFLDEYSIDMTTKARNGDGDPVVGRDKEIKRVIQILSRRTKNNPILLGEPGVGKTAIAEGLSQHIAKGNVPKGLLKKRILSLDLAALIAGTKYRGEFEERMKRIMKEIKEDKNIILFIDELHTIIGAGGPEGTMDASNMLKPALSRGELQIIGATTLKEYRKYFEKDSALERRFQVVKVEEPSDDDTTNILEGLKSKYEEYHGVEYASGVIPMIVKLSKRYVPERFLPDKAIDILDEAGAAKKIEEEERPDELTELEHNIDKLDAEKKALVESQDYEKAAIVRDAVVELRQKLEECTNYWQNNNGGNKKIVTEKDVCEIISTMTGVPVEQLDNGETTRLLNMEKEIHKSVIGQDEAIHLISSAVRRSRAGVSSTKRPIGSFIFLGPTGVGKTQL
ncbi:MAG: ATP-dependent Clp protease ATP-binding subunit, partial [Treponema sp.]|nr:ATP-dependent Clp protease ATP-binding subunit [Treponema sp.]